MTKEKDMCLLIVEIKDKNLIIGFFDSKEKALKFKDTNIKIMEYKLNILSDEQIKFLGN